MHLVYAIDNLDSGGAQRQAVALAVELQRRADVRVSFLVYRDEDFFGESLRRAGVEITRIEKSAKIDPLFPARVARWVRENDVDVFHSFLLNPSLWYLLAMRLVPAPKRPVFIAAERDCAVGATRVHAWIQRFVYRGSDHATVNAECVADELHEAYDVPRDRFEYIPNGLDFGAWDRACEEPCPIPLEPGYFHLALVGRLAAQKNHGLLLAALSRLEPDVLGRLKVWFVGGATGPEEYAANVRAEIERRGLEEIVELLPPQKAIASVMHRLDLLVLPSLHEGFPNVALEAMASRTVVVATRVGDVPNLIEDGVTGFSCESGDVEGLARAIQHVYEMSEAQRGALTERARRTVEERYTIEAVADRSLAYYRQLLEARRA